MAKRQRQTAAALSATAAELSQPGRVARLYPDVWASQTSKLLIDTLFPKVPSNVLEPLS